VIKGRSRYRGRDDRLLIINSSRFTPQQWTRPTLARPTTRRPSRPPAITRQAASRGPATSNWLHGVRNAAYCDRWTRSVVCQSVTLLGCTKTAKQIEVLFEVETLGTQGTLYKVGSRSPTAKEWKNWPIIEVKFLAFVAAFAQLLRRLANGIDLTCYND